MATVPYLMQAFGLRNYGLWLAISSFANSFYTLDFGLSNGFRNKFTAALASENYPEAKSYLSTIYAILALFAIAIFLIFSLLSPWIDWSSVLSILANEASAAQKALWWVTFFFCLKLVVSVLNTALIAAHKVALSSFIEMLQILVTFFVSVWFSIDPNLSFEKMVALLSLIPVLVYLFSSLPVFALSLKSVRPAIAEIKFKLVSVLLQKGMQFFIIQITAMFLFTIGGFLAGSIYGLEAAAEFGLINKYYAIPLMGFSIILTPFWAGFTDAWIKNDVGWIKKVIKNLMRLWLLYVAFLAIMVYFSEDIFKLWLGKNMQTAIPSMLSFALGAAFTALCAWGNIFSFFLNGIGYLRIQLLSSLIIVLLMLPLLLGLNYWFGLNYNHIFLSGIITLLIGSILGPYQSYLILKGKAKGIWRK